MENAIQPVLLFSGGRTSGYMLRHLLDTVPDYRKTHLTIFCNTGKEMPQTLDFVRDVQEKWEVPVIWLEYDRQPAASLPVGVYPTKRRNQNLAKAVEKGESAHWFKQVDYQTPKITTFLAHVPKRVLVGLTRKTSYLTV